MRPSLRVKIEQFYTVLKKQYFLYTFEYFWADCLENFESHVFQVTLVTSRGRCPIDVKI